MKRQGKPQPTSSSRRQRFGIPPLWFTLSATVLGIYGTGMLFRAVVGGNWSSALIGFAIMAAAVLLLGTPLAFARYLRWHTKQSLVTGKVEGPK